MEGKGREGRGGACSTDGVNEGGGAGQCLLVERSCQYRRLSSNPTRNNCVNWIAQLEQLDV